MVGGEACPCEGRGPTIHEFAAREAMRLIIPRDRRSSMHHGDTEVAEKKEPPRPPCLRGEILPDGESHLDRQCVTDHHIRGGKLVDCRPSPTMTTFMEAALDFKVFCVYSVFGRSSWVRLRPAMTEERVRCADQPDSFEDRITADSLQKQIPRPGEPSEGSQKPLLFRCRNSEPPV